jgi:DNA-binding CsgD family transcriptional regulator
MDMVTGLRAAYDSLMLDEVSKRQERFDLVTLTPRELEVLQMISRGLTNAEAARRMQLSVHAIKFHLASIYRRLGVNNRTEAAVAYLRSSDGDLETTARGD